MTSTLVSLRIKQLRKLSKLTQEELGKRTNTTKGTISNYENGHSTPSNQMLIVLADVLDATTDYLLGRTDEMNGAVEMNKGNWELKGGINMREEILKAIKEELDKSMEYLSKHEKSNSQDDFISYCEHSYAQTALIKLLMVYQDKKE